MPFLKASWRIFTTFGSMPLGPARPNGEFDTMAMPASFSVGTSGQLLLRLSVQITSRRNCPLSTSGAQPLASATALMWPPSSALVDSDVPRNGTWVHLMPRCLASCSIVRCKVVPAPGVP